MFVGQKENAQRHLLKHLELSTWKAERSAAMRFLSRVTEDTEHWLLKACAEAPNRREPWVETAQFYYDKKAWTSCLSAAERALVITDKPLEYLCEAASWGALPHDLASIAAWNMGLQQRSVEHSINAYLHEPSNSRLKDNLSLVLALTAKTPVEVIIPTRSNTAGLLSAIHTITPNSCVSAIHVIADGRKSFDQLADLFVADPIIAEYAENHKISLDYVDDRSGIHAMWNRALKFCSPGSHVLFLNDDVLMHGRSVDVMSSLMDRNTSIGLVAPNYDNRQFSKVFVDTNVTCRGIYDGTGGLPGFAMMLSARLVPEWQFDESMKWWYGDDDLLYWVNRIKGQRASICGLASCTGNSSWTINNDRPDDFNSIVENDARIFLSKWGG